MTRITIGLFEVFMAYITKFFKGGDAVFIVSQCIGVIAAALLLLSFQQRTHRRIVVMQAFSGFLFAVQYFMLGAFEGMTGNIVGMARAVAYSFRGKSKFADSRACPVVFACLAAIGGAITYSSPVSLLPTLAMVISSFVMWSPKTQKLRALTLPTSLMWLIYNIICRSYSGTATEICCEISIIIGLIRFRSKRPNNQKVVEAKENG